MPEPSVEPTQDQQAEVQRAARALGRAGLVHAFGHVSVRIDAGALGGYFGARLMQAGHDVVFVARGHRLQVLSDSGLTIATEHGTEHFRLDLTDSFEAMASVDLALLCVKTWHIPGVIAQMQAGSISPQRLLTLQNGVEAHLQMARRIRHGWRLYWAMWRSCMKMSPISKPACGRNCCWPVRSVRLAPARASGADDG